MATYYVEPNSVINMADDFSQNSYLIIFNGYIASRKNFISIENAYKKGASCFCCKYSKDRECDDNGTPLWCTCKPHIEMKRMDKEKVEIPVFTQEDFKTEDEHECDERGVCEFFRFEGIECFETAKEIFGDIIGKWYDEQCDDLFFSGVLEEYHKLLCIMDTSLESARKECTKLKNDNINLHSEIKEKGEFLNFFKSEIPDTYKRLMHEYKTRREI